MEEADCEHRPWISRTTFERLPIAPPRQSRDQKRPQESDVQTRFTRPKATAIDVQTSNDCLSGRSNEHETHRQNREGTEAGSDPKHHDPCHHFQHWETERQEIDAARWHDLETSDRIREGEWVDQLPTARTNEEKAHSYSNAPQS